jgi:hypothetical protein
MSRGVLISPCGRNMRGNARKDRGTYRYLCPNTEWNTRGTRCDCKTVPGDWIDEVVWSEVKRVMSDSDRLVALADEYLDRRVETEGSTDDPAVIYRRIDELERARTTTATQALKAGLLDPKLLQESIREIDLELAGWRRRADQA